ncbi:MAG TPA: hypothetical protein VEH27_04310, partial [Methylomirabilota bacterium]|nr:hypothetical protein [Methylomirabilota bacterium]
RDMEVYIIARVTATDMATGKALLDRDVSGRTTLRLADNMASVERQAAPVLAEDLARNITSLLADGSW